MNRIRRANGYKILAILLSSSVLITTTIACLPIASYDFPPRTLFDEFLPEGKFLGYDLWVDAGVWIAIEVSSEFDARIRIETWVESERATYLLSDSIDSHGVFTLGRSSQGQSVFILIIPRPCIFGGSNVRAEIIDSSSTVTNKLSVLPNHSWFLILAFSSVFVDAHLFSGWLRDTTEQKRERKARIKKKRSDDEVYVPLEYVLISMVRILFARRDKSDS
ncbi:MAG: hypothetical protein ACW98J_07645 [Candidatus Thorarchaeota archaeon]|jgi:hypothetical protein